MILKGFVETRLQEFHQGAHFPRLHRAALQHIAIQNQDLCRIIVGFAEAQPPGVDSEGRQDSPTRPGGCLAPDAASGVSVWRIEAGRSRWQIPEVCSPQELRPPVAYTPRGIVDLKVISR